MDQREALETLAEHVGDELVVSGIGSQTLLWHSILHRPGNFYLSGPMGQAVPFGLGLALARPSERVIAIEGDGSLLMNLGSLASAAQHLPANLLVLVMDNLSYELTGVQPMVTGGGPISSRSHEDSASSKRMKPLIRPNCPRPSGRRYRRRNSLSFGRVWSG